LQVIPLKIKILPSQSKAKSNPWNTLHKNRQGGSHPDTLALVKSLTLSAILLATSVAAAQNAPTTIYIHGNILTGSHLRTDDTSDTPAKVTAIAIANGKILAVGDDATIQALKGPNTKVIDLNGAFTMPGFNDAHTHIASAGQQKLTVDLDGTQSLKEMQDRIRAYTAKAQPNTWIQGGGWDHTKWPTKQLPTRADIDAVTAGHPAIFERTDGHIVVANSAALAAANITSATPDPPGSKIDRDPAGNPTGIVRETPAVALIRKVIPPSTHQQRVNALTLAMNDALAHGVTSVQDFSEWEDFLALQEIENSGGLHLRVAEWLAFDTPIATLKERRTSHPGDPFLRTTMLKAFMDGSLGSRTAALNAPYSDDPGNSGIPRYEQQPLNQMASDRAQESFQLGFHAIGDRANDMALDAFEAAMAARRKQQENLVPKLDAVTGATVTAVVYDFRYRIEHAQVVSPGAFDRFAKLHVIASMQPSHLLTDMNWAEARLGPERVKYSYAWRSFLDHGVVLAFGTDYPVESVSPFRGLYAAITRQNEAGTKTYQPQEKITLNEALYAYTQGSAYAEKLEETKGRLEPGYLADLVVLDRDITSVTPQELLHTQVLRTVVNGETVYTAPTAKPSPTGAKN
jgi:predicted amidohydrolase YtcJ